jgi:hypothetical protein
VPQKKKKKSLRQREKLNQGGTNRARTRLWFSSAFPKRIVIACHVYLRDNEQMKMAKDAFQNNVFARWIPLWVT